MKHFWDAEEIAPRTLAPGITAKIAWGEKAMLSLITLEPDSAVPPHTHPHEQIGILMSGAMELTIDGETRRLSGNELYLVPGGVLHSAKAGPGGALAVEAFSPPREEYKSPAG